MLRGGCCRSAPVQVLAACRLMARKARDPSLTPKHLPIHPILWSCNAGHNVYAVDTVPLWGTMANTDTRLCGAAGLGFLAIAVHLSGGCAVHYYDAKTETEHVWGFGHLAMKAPRPQEGVRAVVTGADTLGLGIGSTPQEGYLSLGWHRSRLLQVTDANTQVRLEWPRSGFFGVRVGSEPPALWQSDAATLSSANLRAPVHSGEVGSP